MTNVNAFLDSVKFDKEGLVPAIAQDARSGKVLMLAYMNRESLEITLKEGKMCYWSRSRKELWRKGATSGNHQEVKEIFIDCDGDALVFKVEQTGGACHAGYDSCFFRKVENDGSFKIVGEMTFDAEEAYRKK
ncbi:MAG: phosphoribosyl-AMP cyclohydrolase [Chloroherpetonaceae bacterium]|nr:phosphoribosyl-AMP cyclohydrolase [Chloroherpetonaceae bacterium]MDW8436749.1 phosphoribosyl-AMP cyclohydrolase [Chloroherpetonaceae bacterium]